MSPKAYRWVREMEEIAETHAEEGGFQGDGKGVFEGIANIYSRVADESVLGEEKADRRKRGLTVDDVAAALVEGKRRKV